MMRTAPTIGAPPRLQPVRVQTHTLSNGLLIAVVERPELPIVDVEILVRAGAAMDGAGKAGRAALVAEMLDEGTSTRDLLQIADELDYLGAHLNFSAGWDTTVISLHVLAGRFYQALDVMADVMLDPVFPAAEFERKKRERLTGLLQDRDEARIVANKLLAKAVFGDQHPYGQPAMGTYASLDRMTLEDVTSFYHQHFTATNAFLVVVGAVSFDDVVRELDARFGSWRGGAVHPVAISVGAPARPTEVLLVDKPRAAQAEIRVGHAGPARDTPDYFPLVVLNTMLGGSFTSRLNLRLREEMGVTYGASSKFGWRRHGGLFWAGSAVDTEAAAASVRVMLTEMQRLASEPIDQEEMQRAAQYIAFGLPRSFETTEDVAAHVREQILHGFAPDYWTRYVDHVLAVTEADVAAVAGRHLHPARATAVVVAERGAVEAELRALDLGAVTITDVET